MDITAQEIPLGELHESPWNPRKHFPQRPLEELAQSMREVGVLTPLVVRPRPAAGYEIAAGHRRKRAAVLANLATVPAIVRPLTDQQMLEILTIENMAREDVHPLDEAEGYRTLMKQTGWDADTVAAKVGKSKSYVYQRLKLAELIEPAKKAFLEEKITAGHAILIARLQPKDQAEALKVCSQQFREMSVRGLGEWIEREIHLDLGSAPWDHADKSLVPPAGACTICPKRTGFMPELFPDVKKKDICTDRACFQAKTNAYADRIRKQLEAKGEKLLDLSGGYDHYGNKPARGIPERQWREKVKAGSCPSTRMGIIIDQRGHHRIGEVFPVCVDPKCRIHHPRGYSYVPTAAEKARKEREEAKQDERRETSKRVHLALREKVKAPLPRRILELVAVRFFSDIWHELRVEIVKAWGWAEGPKARSLAYDRTLIAHLPKMSQDELARLLVDLAVARELHGSTYGLPGELNPLRAAAKEYGIDETKIQAAVQKELAEKREAKKAREQKRQKKAKAGAKKQAAVDPIRIKLEDICTLHGGKAPAKKEKKAAKAVHTSAPARA